MGIQNPTLNIPDFSGQVLGRQYIRYIVKASQEKSELLWIQDLDSVSYPFGLYIQNQLKQKADMRIFLFITSSACIKT